MNKASGNKASLTPGKVSFSDGSSYTLERVQLIATTADSKYLRISRDLTPLPTTMTKKGGSGGGEGGDGSEAYNKWLGTWSVDSGAFEMKLRQKTADKSYFMRGWQFEEASYADVEATFESDGSIILYGSTDVPVAKNVDIDAEEGDCNLYYVGDVIIDGEEYYISGNYDLATGRIQADGSAVFNGNEVELSDGGTYQFMRMELIAVPVSDTEVAYTFKEKPSEFPLTASKAGRSSVKAAAAWSEAGAWTRSSIGMFAAARERELFEECTPYVAVPEVPVRFRRHIEY